MEAHLQSNDELRLLSVNDARKILGVRHKTVTDLINENKISATKIGKRYKTTLQSLRDYEKNISALDSNRVSESSYGSPEEIINDLINDYSLNNN